MVSVQGSEPIPQSRWTSSRQEDSVKAITTTVKEQLHGHRFKDLNQYRSSLTQGWDRANGGTLFNAALPTVEPPASRPSTRPWQPSRTRNQ